MPQADRFPGKEQAVQTSMRLIRSWPGAPEGGDQSSRGQQGLAALHTQPQPLGTHPTLPMWSSAEAHSVLLGLGASLRTQLRALSPGFDLCEVGQEEVILKTGKQASRRTVHFALQSLLSLFGKTLGEAVLLLAAFWGVGETAERFRAGVRAVQEQCAELPSGRTAPHPCSEED